MQFAAASHTGTLPECIYTVRNCQMGTCAAFCPTANDAIRIAMALNLMERQKAARVATPKPLPATDSPEVEIHCEHCFHRFPAHKIGTIRLMYPSRQEEMHPCCPMCGEIIHLDETTMLSYQDWWEHYRK